MLSVTRALLVLAMAATLGACGSAPPTGDPAVYKRIASETDCARLRLEFVMDKSAHDATEPGGGIALIPATYMKAAEDRMKAVGCHK